MYIVDVPVCEIGGGMGVVPVVPTPVSRVVRAQALLVHGVDCRRGLGALLAAACSCEWVNVPFVGLGGCWGSGGGGESACLRWWCNYLDRPVEVRGHSVWFGGALHPVERYLFGR